MVDGVCGLCVTLKRDVDEAGGVGIAQGVGNHHLTVVWRTGVWLCAVD